MTASVVTLAQGPNMWNFHFAVAQKLVELTLETKSSADKSALYIVVGMYHRFGIEMVRNQFHEEVGHVGKQDKVKELERWLREDAVTEVLRVGESSPTAKFDAEVITKDNAVTTAATANRPMPAPGVKIVHWSEFVI